MSNKNMVVALSGNPNSGKTTVFNNLTGARQHVGNWPGVTVEKKEGDLNYRDWKIRVVDLPGIYSLTAYSPDELVARDFIIGEKPDVVVNIVDAANLERNLYLTVQIMEMRVPLVLVLNMMDEVEAKGYKIEIDSMSKEMGIPVIAMVANRNKGTDRLLDAVVEVREGKSDARGIKIEYSREVEREIARLQKLLQDSIPDSEYSPRWLAIKLIEGDEDVLKRLKEVKNAV